MHSKVVKLMKIFQPDEKPLRTKPTHTKEEHTPMTLWHSPTNEVKFIHQAGMQPMCPFS